ncbi:hypothetical protein PR048_018974 [Dryococelus australis]|uniref:Uncharacterized protein n=1 Tax=Dryococelus australis TaxID=614101 RepID=A0ABQ9H292_9NEOP|nr:hypothetical protein PR048_018974 [Dryococelus australis]
MTYYQGFGQFTFTGGCGITRTLKHSVLLNNKAKFSGLYRLAIVRYGIFLVGSADVWQVSLQELIGDKRLRSKAGMKGRGTREMPEKTRPPARSSSTISVCENPVVARQRIEPGSAWWEACRLTAQPPRPPLELVLSITADSSVHKLSDATKCDPSLVRPQRHLEVTAKCERLQLRLINKDKRGDDQGKSCREPFHRPRIIDGSDFRPSEQLRAGNARLQRANTPVKLSPDSSCLRLTIKPSSCALQQLKVGTLPSIRVERSRKTMGNRNQNGRTGNRTRFLPNAGPASYHCATSLVARHDADDGDNDDDDNNNDDYEPDDDDTDDGNVYCGYNHFNDAMVMARLTMIMRMTMAMTMRMSKEEGDYDEEDDDDDDYDNVDDENDDDWRYLFESEERSLHPVLNPERKFAVSEKPTTFELSPGPLAHQCEETEVFFFVRRSKSRQQQNHYRQAQLHRNWERRDHRLYLGISLTFPWSDLSKPRKTESRMLGPAILTGPSRMPVQYVSTAQNQTLSFQFRSVAIYHSTWRNSSRACGTSGGRMTHKAAVAERIDCARLLLRITGFNPRPGRSRIFASGNRAGRCRQVFSGITRDELDGTRVIVDISERWGNTVGVESLSVVSADMEPSVGGHGAKCRRTRSQVSAETESTPVGHGAKCRRAGDYIFPSGECKHRVSKNTEVKQPLIQRTPAAHANKVVSLVSNLPLAKQRLLAGLPIGDLSQHEIANEIRSPFTELRAANEQMGTLTSKGTAPQFCLFLLAVWCKLITRLPWNEQIKDLRRSSVDSLRIRSWPLKRELSIVLWNPGILTAVSRVNVIGGRWALHDLLPIPICGHVRWLIGTALTNQEAVSRPLRLTQGWLDHTTTDPRRGNSDFLKWRERRWGLAPWITWKPHVLQCTTLMCVPFSSILPLLCIVDVTRVIQSLRLAMTIAVPIRGNI